MNTSPFDRINLGYEGLFGPRTMFYHLQPQSAAGGALVEVVRVPVLDSDWVGSVEIGTVSVILVGCFWIAMKLVGVLRRDGRGVSERHRKKKTN